MSVSGKRTALHITSLLLILHHIFLIGKEEMLTLAPFSVHPNLVFACMKADFQAKVWISIRNTDVTGVKQSVSPH